MTYYELITITKPDVSSKFVREVIKDMVTTYGGEIETAEDWGVRRLAYPIKRNGKKYDRGFYMLIDYHTPTEDKGKLLIDDLNKYFNNEEDILKHIVVKRDDR